MPGSPIRRARREAARLAALENPEALKPDAFPSKQRQTPEAYGSHLDAEIVELGRTGISLAEIASHWAVSSATLEKWAADNESFREALAVARTASQAWWEGKAHEAMLLDNNRFPAAAWAQIMRARFPEYREKDGQNRGASGDLLARLVIVDLTDEPAEA